MKTRPKAIRHIQTRLHAVHISSNIMSATNISNLLLQNINEPLPVETQLDKALTWGKSLSTLPIFTRREIDLHVRKCGKLKGKSISEAWDTLVSSFYSNWWSGKYLKCLAGSNFWFGFSCSAHIKSKFVTESPT